MTTDSQAAPEAGKGQNEKLVIAASSLGTVFEWYDFYLYGLLATALSHHFFSGVNETTGFILALMAFAAGFAVRPFGALVFGRVGDIVGRKITFLVTMAIMGLSTFAVGFLPGYDTIGVAAPIILMLLRLLQGLAIGGEYGGAAVYIGVDLRRVAAIVHGCRYVQCLGLAASLHLFDRAAVGRAVDTPAA